MKALLAALACVLAVVLWPVGGAPTWPIKAWASRSPGVRRPPSRLAWLTRLSGRAARADPLAGVLDLLDALAPALRAGLPPAAAIRAVGTVSGGAGFADRLMTAAARGSPLGPVWQRLADEVGDPDVELVAAVWSLCDRLGSPLASSVTLAGDVLRRRQAVRRRVDVAVSGPRATMRLLLGMPLAGPVLSFLLGISPGQAYAGPVGVAALTAGGLLLTVGWWWSRRLVRQVFRERSDG